MIFNKLIKIDRLILCFIAYLIDRVIYYKIIQCHII